jgi:hypothetical protein
MKFDLKYLEKLAKLMQDSELTEMQLEDQEQSIVKKKQLLHNRCCLLHKHK